MSILQTNARKRLDIDTDIGRYTSSVFVTLTFANFVNFKLALFFHFESHCCNAMTIRYYTFVLSYLIIIVTPLSLLHHHFIIVIISKIVLYYNHLYSSILWALGSSTCSRAMFMMHDASQSFALTGG